MCTLRAPHNASLERKALNKTLLPPSTHVSFVRVCEGLIYLSPASLYWAPGWEACGGMEANTAAVLGMEGTLGLKLCKAFSSPCSDSSPLAAASKRLIALSSFVLSS